MAYATRDDLVTLGLPADWLSAASEAQQDKALVRAGSVADGYLASRFTLPITVWGDDLRGCVVDLAVYYLASSVIGYNPASSSSDASIKDRFDAAMLWLKDISSGKAVPAGVTDSSAPPDPAGGSTFYVSSDPLRGW